MSKPVQLYCWHFMSYPYLPADFDQKYDTGWVTVPNRLWDSEKSRGLYQEYIDQLAYADELGFDGMVLNEHHQNIYGLMPSPNLIAAALRSGPSTARSSFSATSCRCISTRCAWRRNTPCSTTCRMAA